MAQGGENGRPEGGDSQHWALGLSRYPGHKAVLEVTSIPWNGNIREEERKTGIWEGNNYQEEARERETGKRKEGRHAQAVTEKPPLKNA